MQMHITKPDIINLGFTIEEASILRNIVSEVVDISKISVEEFEMRKYILSALNIANVPLKQKD